MARITNNIWAETFAPRWMGDYHDREGIIPGGAKLVTSAFPIEDAVTVTVGGAGAAIGATAIPVAAISGPIPSGTILDFTGAGEFALLTAAAATGATSLTVEALDAAIEAGDTATYAGVGRRYVQSGTLIGRTFAERAAGTGFGPWATGDDEVYLLVHDVYDVSLNNDADLYRHGRVVKENYLPGFANLSAGALTALRAAYTTTRGAQ